MPRVFQLTRDDLERYGTLDESDLGLWCYVLQGCICGFHASEQEAKDFLATVMF